MGGCSLSGCCACSDAPIHCYCRPGSVATLTHEPCQTVHAVRTRGKCRDIKAGAGLYEPNLLRAKCQGRMSQAACLQTINISINVSYCRRGHMVHITWVSPAATLKQKAHLLGTPPMVAQAELMSQRHLCCPARHSECHWPAVLPVRAPPQV